VVADKVIEDMLKEQVECIVCMDDNICLNVLNKLRRENVSIPEDMKVASFYNSRLLSNYYPPITCLDFDIKELGMTAAKMLLDLLDGKRTSKRIQLGYQVMLKNSTKMPF
ncbi:MAG: substrate-binding domain-containing protein, partial [Lachnospiraceae bacterium]|nr:substrate-binding domain-containing protein [Lachnospiraceae bacterium]